MCWILSPAIYMRQVRGYRIEGCVSRCTVLTYRSTIFMLQEHQWLTNGNNMGHAPNYVSAGDTWDETLSTLDHLATTCQGFRDQMIDTTSVLVATPFLAHVTYQAASFLIRLSQGVPDDIITGRICLFKGLLQDVVPRWKMASMFIDGIASILIQWTNY